MKRTLSIFAAGLAACGSLQSADFQPPHWAGQAGTEFSEWLNFSEAFQAPNNPDIAESTGDAILTQNTPGATITGS